MWDLFISIFVISALALTFAHAWNLVAETVLDTYEIKSDTGEVKKPVMQTVVYAAIVTAICILSLWYIHNHSTIDLGAGFKRKHR